jgi:hypothetical protein
MLVVVHGAKAALVAIVCHGNLRSLDIRNEPEGSSIERRGRIAVSSFFLRCASEPSDAGFNFRELKPSRLVSSAAAV